MAKLIAGLILFLGTHSISIAASAWRDRTVARFGEKAFQGIYALLALAGLVLMIWGYGLARQEPIVLYAPPVWTRHILLLIMVPVFPLLLAAYLPGRIQIARRGNDERSRDTHGQTKRMSSLNEAWFLPAHRVTRLMREFGRGVRYDRLLTGGPPAEQAAYITEQKIGKPRRRLGLGLRGSQRDF